MEAIRQSLIASTQANPGRNSDVQAFATYSLVRIEKQQVSSAGQTFERGELALAVPEVYDVRGQPTMAVFSNAARAHVMLPTKELCLNPGPPRPPPRRKPVPLDTPSTPSAPPAESAALDAPHTTEKP